MSNKISKSLSEVGYSYIESLLSLDQCNILLKQIDELRQSKLHQVPLNLNDSNDKCNVLYTSERSPMNYAYLKTVATDKLSQIIMKKLETLTSMTWSNNINTICQPIFIYSKDGFIKEHRGRNVGFGNNDFVSVVMITKPGHDFSGGQFFLNRNGEASVDGKTIYNEDKSKREYFNIMQGDALIFNNQEFIHGTIPVNKGQTELTSRITTSWRTSK